MVKNVLFLTGTRADYGKIKSLMNQLENSVKFNLFVFVTGMHMLKKYGTTFTEVEKDGFQYIHKYINQTDSTSMTEALSNTISGLNNYVSEMQPDMIVVHGDRLEALAGAIVGAFNNIKVAHIEGGEVSGTIDESIRHAITKFSHLHFVANEEAKKRILQLGENEESIYIIGSPDIDIMYSNNLPELDEVKERYEISFDNYSILMYHPVTTDVENIDWYSSIITDALISSEENYIVIYPNNDEGSDVILNQYQKFEGNKHFKIYPSIRFEHFLTLLRHSKSIIGNSSAGIREASVYGVPSINIGNRQNGRVDTSNPLIISIDNNEKELVDALNKVNRMKAEPKSLFGDGNSSELFFETLNNPDIWNISSQKYFFDRDNI